MPQTCSICKSDDKADIDRQLITGESLRSIAKRFRFSATAVFRHKQSHLPEKLALAKHHGEALSADALIAEMQDLRAKLLEWLKQAERARNAVAFVAFCREYRQTIESLIELSDRVAEKVKDNTQLNINIHYDVSRLETLTAEERDLLQALYDKANGRPGGQLDLRSSAILSLCSQYGVRYSEASVLADRTGQSLMEAICELAGGTGGELKQLFKQSMEARQN